MTRLTLNSVSLQLGDAKIIRDVTVEFRSKELTALVGANGAGKTSLLRCAAGIEQPTSGAAFLENAPLNTLTPVARARRIAYLPQTRGAAWPITVRDAVTLGRFAYGAPLHETSGDDKVAVDRAIRQCGLAEIETRRIDTLSGGETARVYCARAFATEAPVLLADEPIASLDPGGQLAIMSLIRAHADAGAGAVAILHDLQLAARFADRMVWMRSGAVIADGSPKETLTAQTIADVFDVASSIAWHDDLAQVQFLEPIPSA
ncbi:MAG: ABC transporter ATP-binding protein [Pseudomonadota bacterium]